MLLAYVDESYTDDWFTMAALLTDGPAAVGLTAALDEVASVVGKAYDLEEPLEIHGHEIFHARGLWRGVPVRARIGVFDDVIEAIASQDVAIIARGIDLVGQRSRYPVPELPHTVALLHLLERIDDYVASHGEHALVIADEVDGQAKHRADLTTYRDVGTSGYRHRRLTRIVDTLHFAPSHASRLVQAADVVSFLFRRVYTHREVDERSRRAKVAMWGRLRPRVQHSLCWFPMSSGDRQRLWGEDLESDAQRARDSGP